MITSAGIVLAAGFAALALGDRSWWPRGVGHRSATRVRPAEEELVSPRAR